MKNKTQKRIGPAEGGWAEVESYLAPPPPSKGKIIGVDCHPDTFTAAVLVGQTPHDARKLQCRQDLSLQALLDWAGRDFGPQDIFLLEAGSNSFEVCGRLRALGLRAVVLESCHVGKHAKTYADNDKMAAERIAKVYLAGNAPAVWVPDEQTRQRRDLLHAYGKSVRDHTAASNALKAYLNGFGVRLGKRNPALEGTRRWALQQRAWTALDKHLLQEYFGQLDVCAQRRKRLYRLLAAEVTSEPLMLRCMKLLGIGITNAFALMAVIGDVRRFDRPEKLVAYIGLNPGQRTSGTGKNIQVGVGKRGRGDIRHLLVQSAQAVLRQGRATPLGKWGWQIFLRKGRRSVAVVATARKLVVQVWHLLRGNPPQALEADKGFRVKLTKLAATLGTALRKELGLGESLAECVAQLTGRTETPALASP